MHRFAFTNTVLVWMYVRSAYSLFDLGPDFHYIEEYIDHYISRMSWSVSTFTVDSSSSCSIMINFVTLDVKADYEHRQFYYLCCQIFDVDVKRFAGISLHESSCCHWALSLYNSARLFNVISQPPIKQPIKATWVYTGMVIWSAMQLKTHICDMSRFLCHVAGKNMLYRYISN